MSVLFWVVMAVALGVVEIVSVTLFPVFFSISALAALGFYLGGLPDWSQWLVFIAGGLLLSSVLRPIAKRSLEKGPTLKQGYDELVGRQGVVVTEVNATATGSVSIDGDRWSARLTADTAPPIPAGAHIEIREVRGATLVVVPLAHNTGVHPT